MKGFSADLDVLTNHRKAYSAAFGIAVIHCAPDACVFQQIVQQLFHAIHAAAQHQFWVPRSSAFASASS